jgi:hypothetical protein
MLAIVAFGRDDGIREREDATARLLRPLGG